MWNIFLINEKKLKEFSKTTSQSGATFTLVIAGIATYTLGMSDAEINNVVTSLTPLVKNLPYLEPVLKNIALDGFEQKMVIPLAPMVNEVVTVIETARQGIYDLVWGSDAFHKAEVFSPLTDGIKKTPRLLPTYTGNIKLGSFSTSGQAIINASTIGTKPFTSGLSPSYHHFYFNSQYLIPFIPVIIISLGKLFVVGYDIISSVFVQANYLFLQILWKPIIKKFMDYFTDDDSHAGWRHAIRTNEKYQSVSNQASAVSGGNSNGDNDGNGDDNNNPNRNYNRDNYYEELPSLLQAIKKLYQHLIVALQALQDLIRDILDRVPIDSSSFTDYINEMEHGFPGWTTNYWEHNHSEFQELLLSSFYLLNSDSWIFEMLAATFEGANYHVEYEDSDFVELNNISTEGRELLSRIDENITSALSQTESDLESINRPNNNNNRPNNNNNRP